MKHRPYLLILLCILCICLLSGCKRQPEPVGSSSFLLNTFVTVTLYDSEDTAILDRCMEICKEYENLFSKTVETSEIYRLNHRKPDETTFTISDETAALLQKGIYYSELSGGAFDITIEPLSSLWDFTDKDGAVPGEDEIKAAAARVNYTHLKLDGNTLTFLSPDTAIDLGAIAKGYIADRIKDYLLSQGVKSAVINLGGNVLCVGEKPNRKPFKIGLQKPFDSYSETIASMDINDMSVVSSGVYERHFIIDGKNYHHILNPADGYPYANGLISVTIISPHSVDGDGLSTVCFSLGLKEGMKLLDSMEDTYGIFITDDYKIHYSEGAKAFVN